MILKVVIRPNMYPMLVVHKESKKLSQIMHESIEINTAYLLVLDN